ncbi:MAG: sensor histidine kinase [Nakamurella sp.]
MTRYRAGPDRVRTGSLRLRVACSVLALLVCTLTGLGILVNVLLRQALVDDLQTRLDDRAEFSAVLQEQGVTGQTLADKTAGQGVLSTFTAGSTRYVGRGSDNRPAGPPPGGPRPRASVVPTVAFSEIDGSLVATVGLRDGTLQLRTSEAEIDRTLAALLRIELLAGAGMLAVTALLLYAVVGRALRPLHRMTELAARIRDGARGRRLRPTRPVTDLGSTATTIDEMLDALETAEASARQAELRMRQFLADASHDLRTPLAGVIAGSEQLLRTPAGRAEREQRLVAVVRQARRAGRLVDDLLLMTRLDGGTSSMPPIRSRVDVAGVIDAELAALRLRYPGLIADCIAVPDTAVDADPDQLARALGNLLDNGAKAGGPIRLSVQSSQRTVRIMVSDNGSGVPAADRERIFDRFVRLSSARTDSGAGLGLPISRAIARAHGGELRCLPLPADSAGLAGGGGSRVLVRRSSCCCRHRPSVQASAQPSIGATVRC